MPAGKPLTKLQIENAMRYSKSIKAASRYLGCSYQHLKPYMKMFKVDDNDPNSPTLFDVHKNQQGKGIPKFLPNRRKEPNVKNIIETGTGYESFTPEKIKARLVTENYVKDECYHCGFHDKRVTDYKSPLLLNFKDGNKVNYLLSNLELLCYNCYFLYVADPLTRDQVRDIETNQSVKAKPYDWELDDNKPMTMEEEHLENMRALGLID
jgi:hypothetical protein